MLVTSKTFTCEYWIERAYLDSKNQQFTKSDVFLHVGFSAKKSHMPQYVYHNMVNDKKVSGDVG